MKKIKQFICGMIGHIKQQWIWDKEKDYAVNRCKRCGKIIFGCTLEYGRTFGGSFEEKYEIIRR